MGLVYAEIELINGGDLELARRNMLDPEDIKKMSVEMIVDSGSNYMCINETVKEQLDLSVIEKRKGQLANGQIVEYDVVGTIEVKFKNRRCHVDAMVLPGDSEMLLGAIPMEDMDVLIHPLKQELVVNPEHPYYVQLKMKGVRKIK
ncbi:MAG TPA: aspartyl protease family protein [Saprospiraceae bacterium]|nr:aspartyl protease family protein [Saprospiraceae bacterium]HOY12771.1 aspartyl protease family protein [Saprospiraceae bacterium]HPN68565.1 aspartyl protease family protein [Saprospiraceae bacterium]